MNLKTTINGKTNLGGVMEVKSEKEGYAEEGLFFSSEFCVLCHLPFLDQQIIT